MPIEVSVLLDRAGTARKQSYDKKNQERSAYRPQSEDRHRGAEFSASRNRVHAVRYSEATNQWPQPRWRCVSSCEGLIDEIGRRVPGATIRVGTSKPCVDSMAMPGAWKDARIACEVARQRSKSGVV